MLKKTLSRLLLSSFLTTASIAQAQDLDTLKDGEFSLRFNSVVCDSKGFTAARIEIRWKEGENARGIFPTVRTRNQLITIFNDIPPDMLRPTVAEMSTVWSKAEQAMRSSTIFCPETPRT